MATTDWGRVEQAFERAAELADADAQRAFVHELAAREPQVAREVAALLDAETAAERFLEGVGQQTDRFSGHLLRPGQRVDHYRIVDCLGAGGMGVVYRAHDERLSRDVALKFLAAGPAEGREGRHRLVEEARWISRLDHPNICVIHEIGTTEAAQVYIVMARCPGVDLGQLMRQRALSLDEVLRLGLQLSDALQAAHEAGIVHCDLKPANVIVDEEGRARLVDFGIAAALSRAAHDGVRPAGTVAYMAPEQLGGQALDGRCDVWALGALLYEAVTGRRPFPEREGASLEAAAAAASAEPPRPGAVVRGVPPGLDALVTRCLQPDPARRVATAAELHGMLRRVLEQTAEHQLSMQTPAAFVGPTGMRVAADPGERPVEARYLTVLAVPPGEVEVEIGRFGGVWLGSGTTARLAVFGFPGADEFAVQRAVRCAVELGERTDGTAVAVCAGPGWVAPSQAEETVELGGQVFERAIALLQSPAGGVLLDRNSARLVQGYVRVDPVAAGAQGHGDVFRVTGGDPRAGGRAGRHAQTALFGRVHELGLLRDTWERSLEGEQQVVFLSGEPGIGKSRMVFEIAGWVSRRDHAQVVECLCSPHQIGSPLQPVVSYLRGRLFGPQSAASANPGERLRAFLEPTGMAGTIHHLALARLLDVPEPAETEALMLSPEVQKEATLEALLRLLLNVAERPCLLAAEDLHWADPTTLDLLERLWQAESARPLMVLCTHRLEFRPGWSAPAAVTHMRLPRLRTADTRAMVDLLLGEEAVEDVQRADIVERSDGIPLFVEELTADLAENLSQAGGEAPPAVPATLQNALLARLDRLGEAREAARAAAVIGRRVDEALLAEVLGWPTGRLSAALRALQRSGLIIEEVGGGPRRHRFKHALIQDAAYESLSAEGRRTLHGRVAASLAADFPARVKQAPEEVAAHLETAGETAASVGYWMDAAALALERFAIVESARHARRGLAALEALPAGAERAQTELALLATLGPALMAAKGYADQEVNGAYTRARELCDQLGNPPAVFPVLFGLWTFHCVRARHAGALELGKALVAMAERSGEPEQICEAYMTRGITHYFQGQFALAAADFDRAWAAYEPGEQRTHVLRYGQDPGMVIRSYQSWNRWMMGDAEAADADSIEAVELARATRHPFSIAYGLTFAAWHAMNRGRLDDARQLLAESIELCRAHKVQVFLALALALDALCTIQSGGDGLGAMEESLEVFMATGAELFLPAWYGAMAQAAAVSGDAARAESLLAEAVTRSEGTEERWCLAELWRGRALLALAAGDASQAAAELVRARQLALVQGAEAWLHRIEATEAQLGNT